LIRTKGEAGTGNIVEAVRHIRTVTAEIRRLSSMREDELFVAAKELRAPLELVREVAAAGKLPVVNFVAGGISTPADAALAMQLGADGVFVGSGIFKSEDPARTANAIVQATTHFDNPRSSPTSPRDWAPRCAASRSRRSRLGTPGDPGLVTTAGATGAREAPRVKIGVLALQGAFREHLQMLDAIGVEGVAVRLPEDLDEVAGLILPGGESTTMRRLIHRWGLRQPLLDFASSGSPIFGTCAGMIIVSRTIAGGEEPVLPLLDAVVERNAFGRQLDSFECELSVPVLGDTPVHAIFIRAPIIDEVGPEVDVLARLDDGRIVAVREKNVIATSFPPGACRGDALPSPRRHDGGRTLRPR